MKNKADRTPLDVASRARQPNEKIVALLNEHLASHRIKSLQRRGRFIHIGLADGESVYDFGGEHVALNCLTALTDCLRSQHAPVPVLMPAPPTT